MCGTNGVGAAPTIATNATPLSGGGASTTTTSVAGASGSALPTPPTSVAGLSGGGAAGVDSLGPLLDQVKAAVTALNQALAGGGLIGGGGTPPAPTTPPTMPPTAPPDPGQGPGQVGGCGCGMPGCGGDSPLQSPPDPGQIAGEKGAGTDGKAGGGNPGQGPEQTGPGKGKKKGKGHQKAKGKGHAKHGHGGGDAGKTPKQGGDAPKTNGTQGTQATQGTQGAGATQGGGANAGPDAPTGTPEPTPAQINAGRIEEIQKRMYARVQDMEALRSRIQGLEATANMSPGQGVPDEAIEAARKDLLPLRVDYSQLVQEQQFDREKLTKLGGTFNSSQKY